jgi:hypothetical protein
MLIENDEAHALSRRCIRREAASASLSIWARGRASLNPRSICTRRATRGSVQTRQLRGAQVEFCSYDIRMQPSEPHLFHRLHGTEGMDRHRWKPRRRDGRTSLRLWRVSEAAGQRRTRRGPRRFDVRRLGIYWIAAVRRRNEEVRSSQRLRCLHNLARDAQVSVLGRSWVFNYSSKSARRVVPSAT